MSNVLPRFRSNFEETIWLAAKRNELPIEYEKETIPYTIEGKYRPDFLLPNGIHVEAKGKLDRETVRKMLAVKRSNPDLDIRFVFMRANNRVGKKLMYWQWAEKHNFPWAEGTIPLDWWKEENRNV